MKPSDKPTLVTCTQNPDPVYLTIDDVPPALQHSLAYAYATGLTIEMLAIVYDNLKPEWIEQFVMTWLENPPLREKH